MAATLQPVVSLCYTRPKFSILGLLVNSCNICLNTQIQELLSPVLSAVGERYYKVTAEALRVCGELVRVVRPNFQVINGKLAKPSRVLCSV